MGNYYNTKNIEIPVIANNDGIYTNVFGNRILFSNTVDVSNVIYGNDNDFIDNPYITKWNTLSYKSSNDIYNEDTLNLLFNNEYSYLDVSVENNNTLYNKFYYNDLNQLIQNNSYLLTTKIKLNAADILNLDFKKLYYINNPKIGAAYYRLNSISGYNGRDLCTIELIKVNYIDVSALTVTTSPTILTKTYETGSTTGASTTSGSTTGGSTTYAIPIASSTNLGGIKIGYGLYIDEETGVCDVSVEGVGISKEYVDGSLATKLNLSGGTITGDLNLSQGDFSVDQGHLYAEDISINNDLWIGNDLTIVGAFAANEYTIIASGLASGTINTDNDNVIFIVDGGNLKLDAQGHVIVNTELDCIQDVSIATNLYVAGKRIVDQTYIDISFGPYATNASINLAFLTNVSLGLVGVGGGEGVGTVRWTNDTIPAAGLITYSEGDGSLGSIDKLSWVDPGILAVNGDISCIGVVKGTNISSLNSSVGWLDASIKQIYPLVFKTNSSLGTYATNASVNLAFYSNVSLGTVSILTFVENTSIGKLDASIKQIYPLVFKTNSSLGTYATNASVNSAFITNVSLGLVGVGGGTVTSVQAGLGMKFDTITTAGTITLGDPCTLSPSTTSTNNIRYHQHKIIGFETSLGIGTAGQFLSFNKTWGEPPYPVRWAGGADGDSNQIVVASGDGSIAAAAVLYTDVITKTTLDASIVNLATNASVNTALGNYSLKAPQINLQTGTYYTIVQADNGKIIEFNSSSAKTCYLPASGTVTNTQITIVNTGSGALTISASTGATVHSISSKNRITDQYGAASAYTTLPDEWNLFGDLVV